MLVTVGGERVEEEEEEEEEEATTPPPPPPPRWTWTSSLRPRERGRR